MEAKDYKFANAAAIDRTAYRSLKVATAGLAPVVEAFVENMNRVVSVVEFVMDSPEFAADFARHRAMLSATIENNVFLSGEQLATFSVEVTKRFIQDEHSKEEADLTRTRNEASNILNLWVQVRPSLKSGIDGIFGAMITGTWTAFEVMATDLWEQAINCHPAGLAHLPGTDKDKQVSLTKLQKFGYDLRASMGTLLKDKLGPRGLADIRNGYRLAFDHDCATIEQALKNSAFDQLQAIRNVLVHRAGIADEKFRGVVSTTAWTTFELLEPGKDRIVLNGEIVQDIVRRSIEASTNLIRAVDAWLSTH